MDLALINNSLTPYRLHVHRRIAREMPDVRLHSIFTHELGSAAWQIDPTEEINPVLFGAGEKAELQSKPFRQFHEWSKGGRIVRYLRDHQVQAVVIGGYNDLGRQRIINWCRRAGVACFLFADSNIGGDRSAGWKAKIKRWLVTRVVRKCTGVMPCGSRGRAYFEKYGASPDRIFYFPYEPDYAQISGVTQMQIEAVWHRFDLQKARRHLIYSGRLVAIKRVDLLIDAFASVAKDRPDWDLIIAGDGPLRAALESRVPSELRGRVKWLGFIGEQGDLSAIYRTCDVLVLPSDYEPWAVVINEAAAAGMAIVASDVVGAAVELVQDGVNGRIFKAGDLASLSRSLLDVTEAGRWELMKAESGNQLAAWRRAADPLAGLRRALEIRP